MAFFKLSKPQSRRVGLAWLIGILVGLIGGIAKWGWEIPFPPRNPHIGFPTEGMLGAVQLADGTFERVTPPQLMLEMLGLPYDWTYTFSGVELPLSIFIVHMLFSVVFGVIYCVSVEYFPVVKIMYGMVFGIVVNVLAHVIVMPLMGLVPPLSEIPLDEHLSEWFGHMFWLLVMEVFRRELRRQWTNGLPEAA
ncbi:MAG: DUF1440 domain-containing protein [Capnocytophaga sp.]|nr:DUF1440 domain-containing protein [Capnocytophaga sp.]